MTASRYDLLLRGATVVTADPGRPRIDDTVVGIAGDRIALLASASELTTAAEAATVVALPGRVVTPGFVNVHTHAALAFARGVAEDLGGAPAYMPGVPTGSDLTPDDAVALARLGALEALTFGSTLIVDTYVHAEHTVEAMATLGLRVCVSPRIHDADLALVREGRWEHRTAIGQATLGAGLALAERWNGADTGRIAVHLAAHAADTCSDDFLREVAAASRRTSLRVAIHLAQSRAEVERVRARSGRTPAELLDETGLLDERLIAAHAIFLDAADIARVGRARATIAHVPKGNATGGAMAPTPALRAAGARLALATDNMHADMVEAMRWALATARVQDGGVSAAWQPADALAMATVEGARTLGLDSEIGSLAVGRKADLVVWDFRRAHLTPHREPLGTLVHCGQGRDVEMVLVDGRIVVADGRPTLADEEEIRASAAAAAARLWARARQAL